MNETVFAPDIANVLPFGHSTILSNVILASDKSLTLNVLICVPRNMSQPRNVPSLPNVNANLSEAWRHTLVTALPVCGFFHMLTGSHEPTAVATSLPSSEADNKLLPLLVNVSALMEPS